MKKTILVLLVIVALGWAVFDFFSTSNGTAFDDNNNLGGGKIFSPPSAGSEGKVEETDEVGISLGQIAPDFQLKTLNGETVHLSDFRGGACHPQFLGYMVSAMQRRDSRFSKAV